MTRKEFLREIKRLDKKKKALMEQYDQLYEEYEKNIPFPKGSFVKVTLKGEKGGEYDLYGYIQSWHFDEERVDFRPELFKVNRYGIVSRKIYYPWKDDIIKIERWTPK